MNQWWNQIEKGVDLWRTAPDWLVGVVGVLAGLIIGILFTRLVGAGERRLLRQKEEEIAAGWVEIGALREEATRQWHEVGRREVALAKAEGEIRAKAEELQIQISQFRDWVDQVARRERILSESELDPALRESTFPQVGIQD